MPCCKAEKYGGWCKDLPVVGYKDEEGKEYCVFHAPQGGKGISLEEFNKLVFEKIDEAKEKGELCQLYGIIFEGDISFHKYGENNLLPRIIFHGATFNGKADFRGTTFSKEAGFDDAIFIEETTFFKATFNGDAIFCNTIFGKEVNFTSATFNEYADFNNTAFGNEVSFNNAILNRKADFSNAKFKGKASFRGATFIGKTDFLATNFSGDTHFCGCTFDKEVTFNVLFNKKAIFTLAIFSGKTIFFGETFLNCGFLRGININGEIRFEQVNLKKVSFIHTDLRKIDFIICNWDKKFGRNIMYDELLLFKDEKKELQEDEALNNTLSKFKHKSKKRFEGTPFEIFKREWANFKKYFPSDKDQINKVFWHNYKLVGLKVSNNAILLRS